MALITNSTPQPAPQGHHGNRNVGHAIRVVNAVFGPGEKDTARLIVQRLMEAGLLAPHNAVTPAHDLAALLLAANGQRPELWSITAGPGGVHIAVEIGTLTTWYEWCEICGIDDESPRGTQGRVPYAETATGTHNGIPVHLTGYGVPSLLREAAEAEPGA
mgnify:CR=1 FL=1